MCVFQNIFPESSTAPAGRNVAAQDTGAVRGAELRHSAVSRNPIRQIHDNHLI